MINRFKNIRLKRLKKYFTRIKIGIVFAASIVSFRLFLAQNNYNKILASNEMQIFKQVLELESIKVIIKIET